MSTLWPVTCFVWQVTATLHNISYGHFPVDSTDKKIYLKFVGEDILFGKDQNQVSCVVRNCQWTVFLATQKLHLLNLLNLIARLLVTEAYVYAQADEGVNGRWIGEQYCSHIS